MLKWAHLMMSKWFMTSLILSHCSVFGDIVLQVIDSVVHSIVFFSRYFNASYITCLFNFQLDYSEVWTTVQIWLSFDFIQELMNYARKLDIGLLCPHMEIRPRTPKNGIFQKFFIFVERSPDFASNEPLTTPDIKFKSSYARKLNFGLLCPNMEIQPQAPKMEFFKKFSFFW